MQHGTGTSIKNHYSSVHYEHFSNQSLTGTTEMPLWT